MGISSHLSRANMANWTIKLGILFKRLLFLLNQELLLGPLVFIDETTLQVLKEEGRHPTSKSYMWILCGGVPGKPGVLFVYNPSRTSSVARGLLDGYQKIVMADGYAGYNFITRSAEMKLSGCWAHARRELDDVLKAKDKKSQKSSPFRLRASQAKQLLTA
ncbi:MAG: transposase [Proteobacteria bacterium]|nr:transposase [Pseudomonadota bacterium]